ncbi:MAG: hypothetical protein HQ596_08135 [Candidatus Saganbacteria bacterium]|nr:hypothetical protein [Candidatus Saganbacteria bacterium]
MKKYLVTLILLLPLLTTLSACVPTKPNQTSPIYSESKKYILTVPMVKEKRDNYTHWWKVAISDSDKNLLYKDEVGFPARFNVYWCWDENDRVWLHNSDNGKVYYFENVGGKWLKKYWGAGGVNESGATFSEPEKLRRKD